MSTVACNFISQVIEIENIVCYFFGTEINNCLFAKMVAQKITDFLDLTAIYKRITNLTLYVEHF